MFVKVGDEVPVKDLMQGIAVASGNDASVAMAEYIAGTEEAFASIMNAQAQSPWHDTVISWIALACPIPSIIQRRVISPPSPRH